MGKSRRNCFISYHHASDQFYKDKLTDILKRNSYHIKNYSLVEDIGGEGDRGIYRQIKNRLWGSSILIVLIGKETATRKWIDLEIETSLKWISYALSNPRRVFKPKGILAIQLPGGPFKFPKLLQRELEVGYAVSMSWSEVEQYDVLKERLEQVYENRSQKKKPKPSFINRLLTYFKR